MRSLLAPLAALMLASSAAAEVAEPPTIWTGAMQGETPSTLAGAEVIDAETVARLRDAGAVLLDVAAPAPKPEKMPENTPWMPVHMSIPGAVWLANAGSASLSPDLQSRFGARIEVLTGGDRGRSIVVFCHPKCWGSWNAGKRLVMMGYRKVFWFPGGVEAWQEKFAAAPASEDEQWTQAGQ
jgi:PQQ-dependent catabolism-associated CXXCW motif protein